MEESGRCLLSECYCPLKFVVVTHPAAACLTKAGLLEWKVISDITFNYSHSGCNVEAPYLALLVDYAGLRKVTENKSIFKETSLCLPFFADFLVFLFVTSHPISTIR